MFGALVASVIAAASPIGNPIGFSIGIPTNFTMLQKGHYNGTLYSIELPDDVQYESGAAFLLDLRGSRYQQGYDYGLLAGLAAEQNYNALVNALLKTGGIPGATERFALETLVDNQWDKWLSKQVPDEYIQEIAGFDAGAKIAGASISGKKLMGRVHTLANLPGTIADIKYIFADELLPEEEMEQLARDMGLPAGTSVMEFVHSLNWPLAQCSMWGSWGSRTRGGELLSGRNLDWNQNTGLDVNKMVAVWHPPEAGRHAHATFGFSGTAQGALTGMSEKGLTMHEANLESNKDSFRGFPWLLRLRYVMENAATLAEATAVLNRTKNTVGFNHMIGSAADKEALVFETMYEHTAEFGANDEREANAAIVDPKNQSFVVKGAPMAEAVFRTNHGFDPKTVSHFMWNGTDAYHDSDYRYHILSQGIRDLGTAGVEMTFSEAINITALLGQKGNDYFKCEAPYGGTNVVSVAYDPSKLTVYAAWEDGANATWKPACCSTYTKLEMARWFA